MELRKKNKVTIGGKGILTATKKGTRKFDKDGKLIDPGEIVAIIENPNIICNEGLQLIAGFTIDESATYDTGLTYCEMGTGTTAPAAGDTTLTTFHHRNAVTGPPSRAAYETTFSTFFTAAESTAAIEEAGIWGGGDAAAGEATGLLFAHFLASFNNAGGLYDITITYILSVSRG